MTERFLIADATSRKGWLRNATTLPPVKSAQCQIQAAGPYPNPYAHLFAVRPPAVHLAVDPALIEIRAAAHVSVGTANRECHHARLPFIRFVGTQTIKERRYGYVIIDCPPAPYRVVLAGWRAAPDGLVLIPVDGPPALRAVHRLRAAWQDAGLDASQLRVLQAVADVDLLFPDDPTT